jgi:capsular polysaccharide biosynthesis protein
MTVFVFDASYPSQDVALRLADEPHLFIADRPIDPPAGHRALRLADPAAFAADRRRLRAAWRTEGGSRSLIIAGRQSRPDQLLRHVAQALLLGGPVGLFDGQAIVPLRRAWPRLARAALALAAHATVGALRARWLDRRLRKQAPPDPEGQLYGRHTRAGSFPLPPDRVTLLPPGSSLYGRWTDGWYLPKFSHAAERYAVAATRHRLNDVALHVEEVAGGEVSALFRAGRILDYPYMIGRHPILHTYAVGSRRQVSRLERGVALLYFTAGYYHWIVEGIPRVLDILDDGIDLDRYPLLLPPLEAYQREFLGLMGVDVGRQVRELDKGDWCHVADCIFPTAYFPFAAGTIEDPSGRPDAALLRRIADRVLARLPPPREAASPRRIYVSRAAAAKRKLTAAAEAELVAALEPLGFQKVVLEQLSWPEQVRLFAGADFIVAVHGAGLANLPFARARALVEIHNPLEARAYFATIARELGMEYAYVVATQAGQSARFDNLTVDVAAVASLVARIDAALSLSGSCAPGGLSGA